MLLYISGLLKFIILLLCTNAFMIQILYFLTESISASSSSTIFAPRELLDQEITFDLFLFIIILCLKFSTFFKNQIIIKFDVVISHY